MIECTTVARETADELAPSLGISPEDLLSEAAAYPLPGHKVKWLDVERAAQKLRAAKEASKP